jgi:Glucodextranase, domain B
MIAGCGAAGPPPAPKVSLSITAPTSGATVGVREIVVAGTVAPGTAQVLVSGQPAHVTHGSFTQSLRISQPSQTITISAQASGYASSSASTTIKYSPTVAGQIVAARAAQTALSHAVLPTSSPPRPAPPPSGGNSKAVNSAFALHAPATTTMPSSSAQGSSSPAQTPTTPTTTPTSGTGSQPVPAPAPVPTIAQIKLLWLKGCAKAGKGENFTPYCTCTYYHLEKRRVLSSRSRLRSLMKKLEPFERTHDPARLPRFVRAAITACLPKLPPLERMTGHPALRKLPGLAHAPLPQPTAPVAR